MWNGAKKTAAVSATDFLISAKNMSRIKTQCGTLLRITMKKPDMHRIMPAEWSKDITSVLIAYPHENTDWAYMLDEARECFNNIIKGITDDAELTAVVVTPDIELTRALLPSSLPADKLFFIELPTDDTWARDFGPITVDEGGQKKLVDFQFNGWGLKFASSNDNLVNMRAHSKGAFTLPLENRRSFVLEGGSIESDGRGTIMTTSECLMSPNRNGGDTREEIENELKRSLGAERVLWLDHGYLAGDDTDSHIDTLARFTDDHTILYVKSYIADDPHNDALGKMESQLQTFLTADGQSYNLIGLPLPDPIYDEDGERLPATYANFLITPKAILMPVYGQPMNDELATQMMRIAFPDHKIVGIDCNALIKQHGSLHCVTMQLHGGATATI